MPAEAFLDSNGVRYPLSPDAAKAGMAQALLRQRPVISVQVLNEVTRGGRRKAGLSWRDAAQFVGALQRLCARVVPLTGPCTSRRATGPDTLGGRSMTPASWPQPRTKAAACCTARTCTSACAWAA